MAAPPPRLLPLAAHPRELLAASVGLVDQDVFLFAGSVRDNLTLWDGTVADAASIKLPRRIPYHVAMELLLTGRTIDAREAKQWGLVNEILPADGLMDRARALAQQLAAGPPLVFAAIKEIIRETSHLPIQQAFDMVTKRRLPTVDKLYSSEDQKEGARAFAEKRDPVWRGR